MQLPFLNAGLWALALCATPSVALAQDIGSIRGVVRNARTGEPERNVEVTIVETGQKGYSIVDGTFSIAHVPAGHATLLAARGTKKVRKTVHVGRDRVTKVNLFLQAPSTVNAGYFERPVGDTRNYRVVGTRTSVGTNQLRCEIVPAKQQFRVGDVPAFRVFIHNESRHEVLLVGSLDGSPDGNRYPIAMLDVLGPPGGLSDPPAWASCGWLNSLRPEDFIALEPGGQFEPYALPFFSRFDLTQRTFAKPGDFVVTFRYATNEIDMARWVGQHRRVYELVKQVPRVDLRESITVHVVE